MTDQKPTPDFIYDPDGWETTYSFNERSDITDCFPGELWEPRQFCTLIDGPPIWAVEVVLTMDEAGDPDETEVRWFNSEAEAQAATFKPASKATL